ncbi:MAG: hypothetical protein MUF04_09895, partial [Akkermansiaceae bacterium]|jgi:hypothetical protein|nr:hypothetical protein [Akkermansiaceae bacterium]
VLGLVFWRRAESGGAAILAAVGAYSVVGLWDTGLPRVDRDFGRRHLAIVDFSLQPNASKHSATDAGLHGINLNLLRHGKLPIAMNRWDGDLLDRARYVFLVAPQTRPGMRQRDDLNRFMHRGGTVVLTCGFLDATGSAGLLEPLGVRHSATPLGRFFNLEAYGQRVSFMSAWTLDKVPGTAEVLCQTPDQAPLIVSVPVGKGRLILISDSEFFHNRNLEGHKNHDPQNTAFFKILLDRLDQ